MKIDIKNWYDWKSIAVLLLLGTIAVFVFFNFWSMFSSFGVAIMLVSGGIAFLLFVDKYIFKEIDTFEQVKGGNLAYVALLGIIAYMLVELTKAGLGN